MSRPKKLWEYNNKKYTIDEICKIANISRSQFDRLIKKGWTIDQIINRPPPHTTHGMSDTRLYRIYKAMKTRCYNTKNDNNKKYYHDKGITICDEWLNDFKTFYDWSINNGYDDDLTIDRIDNDKGYSPDNCRWATLSEQQNNTQQSIRLEYNGELLTIREIAEIEDISWQKAYRYYIRGDKIKLPRTQLYGGDAFALGD